jgi:hypothetical protein
MPKKTTLNLDDDVLSIIVKYQKKQGIEFFGDALNQFIREKAKEPITSDVPLGEPQNPEKEKAIQELKEEATRILPPPQCNYVGEGKGYIDKKTGVQMVFCDNPKKYKEPKPVPLSSCISCWKRKEWAKEKREQEQEKKTTQQQEEEEPFKRLKDFQYKNEKEARLLYHCSLKNKWMHLLDLPCVREWDKNNGQILCAVEPCASQILDKIYD